MTRSLAQFAVTPAADGFELRIQDDAGDTIEVLASEEQLELIAEEIERALDVATLDEEDAGEADEESDLDDDE